MDNKKNKIMTLLGIVAILITVIGLTYAFFAPQAGGTTSTNATVTSNTTDLLTFSINRDISFTVTQAMFTENGTNQSGDATATATLTPNNKTGAATMNYYLYLNIESNPTVYSAANTNEDPELMLQVFDGNNQLVTLTGLGTQKTIKGVTGYDITGVSGLKTLLDNHAISASNNSATIENWRIVITLINLDVNQNDNTGKTIEAEIIIQREELSLGYTGTIYRNNTRVAFNNHPIEDELVSAWCYEDNGVPDCTYPYPTQATCENNEGTCSQNIATVGVGNYVTNVNNIRTESVYCLYNSIEDENSCDYGISWATQTECESFLTDNNVLNSTCEIGIVTRHYYLKHEVEEDIIESTEVCLYYNNAEFCLGPNYWDTDGTTTKNKLQTAMEAALGTQADSCSSNSGIAYCDFGDFYCSADAYGFVVCSDGIGSCEVYSDGSSGCHL